MKSFFSTTFNVYVAHRHNQHHEEPRRKNVSVLQLPFTCQTHKTASGAFCVSLEIFHMVFHKEATAL